MSKKNGSAFTLKYLMDHTTAQLPISSVELRHALDENGYTSDVRTIEKMINQIIEAGFDVTVTRDKGKAFFYALQDQKGWDPIFLQLLMDIVVASPLCTSQQTTQIIEQLADLAFPSVRESLTPVVVVPERFKAQTRQIYYVLTVLHNAIPAGRKISFTYTPPRQVHLKKPAPQEYVISPYYIVYRDQYFYLAGRIGTSNDLDYFRLDAVSTPKALDEDSIPGPASFILQEFVD